MRLLIAIIVSVFFLTACGSDHKANGIWETVGAGDVRFLEIEPNGEESFLITEYKNSIWTGDMHKKEYPGLLIGGDVITYGNIRILHKQKSDQLILGTVTLNRIRGQQLDKKVNAIFARQKDEKNHSLQKMPLGKNVRWN